MIEDQGDSAAPQTPQDVLEAWVGHRSAEGLKPQAWVTDDGRFAIRWFGDKPPIIMRIAD